MEQQQVAATMEQSQYPDHLDQIDVPQHQAEESLTPVAEICELPKKRWQCDRCGKVFKQADGLKRHIEVVHKGVKCTCKICGATLKWKNNLKKHMRKMHNVENPPLRNIKCQRCDIIFSSNYLLNHHIRTDHKGHPFKCEICSKTFANRTAWGIHKLDHQELVIYSCSVCRMRYRSNFFFQMHVKNTGHQQKAINHEHEVPESKKKDPGLEKAGRPHLPSEENKVADSSKNYQSLVCPKCNKQFTIYKSFRVHVNKVNGCSKKGSQYMCPSKISHCKPSKNRYPNPSKIVRPSDTQYRCRCCAEVFDTIQGLKVHMGSTHAVKVPVATSLKKKRKYVIKYPCPVCKMLVSHSGLAYHAKKHAGMTNYSCDQCDYKCILETDLAKHLTKHTGEKQFKCRFCCRQFTGKMDLIDHENKLHLHIGVKPYQCDRCLRKFHYKDSHKGHVRKCKGGVWCEESTTSKSHIGFRCVCSAVFSNKQSLTIHKKKVHTHGPVEKASHKTSKQRPVEKENAKDGGKEVHPEYHPSCSFCSKIFIDLRALVVHENKCIPRKDARKKASGSKVSGEGSGRVYSDDGLDQTKAQVTHLNSKQSPVLNNIGGTVLQPEHLPNCPFCWEIFSNLGALVAHEDRCGARKGKALISKYSREGCGRDNKNNGHAQTYEECGTKISSYCATTKGMKDQRNQECKGLKRKYLTTDQGEPKILLIYYCSTCGKSTAEMIRQECPFHQVTCSLCKLSFESDQDLEAHLTTEHLDEHVKRNSSSNICSKCGKTTAELVQRHIANHLKFNRNDSATRVQRQSHSGKRSANDTAKSVNQVQHKQPPRTKSKIFQCSLCTENFCIERNLRVHMRTHKDVLPFPCSYCIMSYGTGLALQTHMKDKHMDIWKLLNNSGK